MRATIRAILFLAFSASLAQAQPSTPPEATDAVDIYIKAQMQRRQVPGLSLAIIQNGKVIKAKGYGVLEKGSTTPVTPSTLFQAGSISKPVAAVGALRLVERGEISLDEDVNTKLRTWRVPENEFTKEKKVTPRGLMSHTAGLTVHGFPGYAVDGPMPTLVQVLDGEKPTNTAAIRVDKVPGSLWRYSGGGYTVLQQLVIDVTGKTFPQYMRESVLSPLGMTASTYDQPLAPERAKETAGGVYSDGRLVPGRWHVYPEMAAAGLWTTPSDLARFAVGVQRSLAGESESVLSRETTRQMLTKLKDDYGLGFGLDGKGASSRFGHGGRDEGFDALLTAYAESGQGAVIMINANENSGMVSRIVKVIAKEYNWPDHPRLATPKPHPPVSVDAKTLAALAGYYAFEHTVISISPSETKEGLIGTIEGGLFDDFIPESETTYVLPDLEGEATFEKNEQSEVIGLSWKSGPRTTKATRIGPLIRTLKPQTDPDAALSRKIESALRAFERGGESVKEVPGVTPGARRDFTRPGDKLAGLRSLSFVAARDVADRRIVRHDGKVSRVHYYDLLTDKTPRHVLVYLTDDNLVTDFDVIEDPQP
jgi:CubicO group peptidase (beta-lactamase class C family)